MVDLNDSKYLHEQLIRHIFELSGKRYKVTLKLWKREKALSWEKNRIIQTLGFAQQKSQSLDEKRNFTRSVNPKNASRSLEGWVNDRGKQIRKFL